MNPKEYTWSSPSVVIKLACKDNFFIYNPQIRAKKMADPFQNQLFLFCLAANVYVTQKAWKVQKESIEEY
jgi:hypothetical protein